MVSPVRVTRAALMVLLLPLLPVLTEDDVLCLRHFKESVSDPLGYLSNWAFSNNSAAGYICTFVGVTCWHEKENKVFSLKLPGGGLVGKFPQGLGNCSSLQVLDLSENKISGSIPSDICSKQLQYLTTLDLSTNNVSGLIPADFLNCKYLNVLNLQNNQLTGQIPWGIGVLSRLSELDLSNNNLSGQIPSSFSNRSEVNKSPFPASSFSGNPGLCGLPLSKSCMLRASHTKKTAIVGAAVGIAVVLVLVIGWFIWWTLVHPKGKVVSSLRDEHKWAKRIKAPKSIVVSMFEKPLVRMRFSDLIAATNEFSKDNIIGSGRTGIVYKATLLDGSVMAIKRLLVSAQTDKQFKSEMNTLGQLRHRNLVPLLGYCVAGGEKLLVYKHMPNGSLRDCLHDLSDEVKIDWPTRLKIGIGAARGLAWLHHSCNPRIIHRNISASSILLDDDYEPRITDFGLARLMNPDDTHISTFVNGDFGDVGYVAPEYIRTLVATVKGDVYSFGVVLLELVTGQRATDVCGDGDFKGNLAEWIAFLAGNGRLQEAIDVSLRGTGVDNEVAQFLRIACSCVLPAPKERPTLYEVYQLLRSIGQKYNFTDQNDEIQLTDTMDAD